MDLHPLGHLELDVMKVVWDRGNTTVMEVLGVLQRGRRLHYNTVMTVMNRLFRKGWLARQAGSGRAYRYQPRISRKLASQTYLRTVTRDFFDGSVSGAIAAFLGSTRPSASEISRLKTLLNEVKGKGMR